MILSDTLTQPKALAIYALLGAIFGTLYALNYFTCAYLIKNRIYRHTSQVLYALIYGLSFFFTTYIFFDYDLKIYHILICLLLTAIVSTLLYLPIRKHNDALTARCDKLRTKILQSKLVSKFKK